MRLAWNTLKMLGWVWMVTVMVLLGCGGGGSDNSGDGAASEYGGSMPKGDYVTAETNGDRITIKNFTEGTETTLSVGDLPADADCGSSIIRLTAADNLGNHYLMALVDDHVLGLHKMDAALEPIITELPVYMFDRSTLSGADLKGRAFNFMELFADTAAGTHVEIGIVGFDNDESGKLYGAAYDSDLGDIYSITDEDGIPDSGDEFSLDLTQAQPDGSLVLWENGADNWLAATTLTGSANGPVVLDHGPEAGGGAGFALPQVTETDPDAFWNTVGGDYFLIVYVDTGSGQTAEYFKCVVAQESPGQWGGRLDLFSLADQESPLISIPEIIPLSTDIKNDIESLAAFGEADSGVVQNAAQGRGVFQENAADPDYFVVFDPSGHYIMGIKLASDTDTVTGFGLGIRDRNWVAPVPGNL